MSKYPGEGNPRADFLWYRARYLVALAREGETPEQSAALMRMDPDQVRLILMSREDSEIGETLRERGTPGSVKP